MVLLCLLTWAGGAGLLVREDLLLQLLIQFRLYGVGEEGFGADNGGGLVAGGEDRGRDGLEAVRRDCNDAGGQLDYSGLALRLSLGLAVKLVPDLPPLLWLRF